MPVENLEEEGLEKNPNYELAQWKFLLQTPKYKNDKEIKTKILKFAEENSKKNISFREIFISYFSILLCH